MWNKLREVGTGRQLSMDEFELCVGSSPIVQELMRRQNVEDRGNDSSASSDRSKDGAKSNGGGRPKRRSSWLRSLKNVVVAGQRRDRRSSDEKDTSSEKGGRRSSSATDDSQDALQSLRHSAERIKVRQYGKSHKELTGLFLSQEIEAHNGSIWTIKFSLDGRYLASAGEDRVIHAWRVFEHDRNLEFVMDREGQENVNANPLAANPNNGLPEEMILPSCMEGSHWKKKRSANSPFGSKYVSSDNVMMPEQAFALSERPVCSFIGHINDVLDLSWSKSQYLLSSSMDMTVRLWHLSSNSCLKIFSHSDYVTCIQFNPIDERYFISGSLDAKVRLWSIPDGQVVDWNDLHEIITATCYKPDGQGALVGSNEGKCHLFDTSENKLLRRSQIDLPNKKKKSSHRKITGFQFTPGSSSEVLITSADSRIRVIDGNNLVYKFKGFRNTSSQICAYPTTTGKHVICASEDSNVYIWRYDADTRPSRSNSVSQSYEHFHCLGVTVAVPWPNTSSRLEGISLSLEVKDDNLIGISNRKNNSDMIVEASGQYSSLSPEFRYIDLNTRSGPFGDRVAGTWPEEKLHSSSGKNSVHSSGDLSNGDSVLQSRLAWGMVIVTASRGGVIRIYQNYGLPVRV
ncbi:hypothetical protein KFK09_018227 [Dendrobium nobile]|uniref:WD repeat-containing protein 44 n=1 Tax=Dendrobium nobile TaxID=94219 RepID=A0A8T3AUP8_DENNO|nr:hypothetical protein KFK09_018227 [Dendrobium nobile]